MDFSFKKTNFVVFVTGEKALPGLKCIKYNSKDVLLTAPEPTTPEPTTPEPTTGKILPCNPAMFII